MGSCASEILFRRCSRMIVVRAFGLLLKSRTSWQTSGPASGNSEPRRLCCVMLYLLDEWGPRHSRGALDQIYKIGLREDSKGSN